MKSIPEWPKRPDGTNKTMGEMTEQEQLEQAEAAVDRLQAEFSATGVQVSFGGKWRPN